MAPPPPAGELGKLRALLDDENATAFEHARAWAAQLIVERRSTQVLVVSDTPAQHLAANRRLESTLHRYRGEVRVTPPRAIQAGASWRES